jgi:hypothetical protein
MNNYTTFKKYPDVIEARHLQDLLIENGIECIFIDNSPRLGSSFSGELLKEYEIQLKQSDFEKANEVLESHTENMLSRLGDDYYLLSFTDDELYDVIVKQDEWSQFDYVLAKKLLRDRGKSISEAEIKNLRQQRLHELAKPEKNHSGWIIAGYIFALLGGFFGVITGYVIYSSKKTLPNGQRVPTYTASDRTHGKIILITGIAVLLLLGLAKILNSYVERL